MTLLFRNSFGVELTVESIVAQVINFMKDGPNFSYKIVIGTDSAALPDKQADFVTAIVVHRIGNGGRYFWRRIEFGKFYTLRDRIIQEVLFSIDVAKEVLETLKKSPKLPHWDFEIHADIGEKGETRVLIQEVVGIIRANNFEAKTKPESYAASNVADRHVK